eukprot:954399-Amphidinium_carterae.1
MTQGYPLSYDLLNIRLNTGRGLAQNALCSARDAGALYQAVPAQCTRGGGCEPLDQPIDHKPLGRVVKALQLLCAICLLH